MIIIPNSARRFLAAEPEVIDRRPAALLRSAGRVRSVRLLLRVTSAARRRIGIPFLISPISSLAVVGVSVPAQLPSALFSWKVFCFPPDFPAGKTNSLSCFVTLSHQTEVTFGFSRPVAMETIGCCWPVGVLPAGVVRLEQNATKLCGCGAEKTPFRPPLSGPS